MNRISLVFLVFLSLKGVKTFASEVDKVIPSKIKKVTVFLSGAEITRNGETTINPGVTQLKFENLSPYLDKEGIQVNGYGKFTILSVNHQLNYLKETTENQEIKPLNKQKRELQQKINLQTSQLDVLEKEQQMILANQKIGGEETGLKVTELQEAASFFRTRLTNISSKKLEINILLENHKEELKKIEQQINTQSAALKKSTSEVVVIVESSQNTSAELEIKYFVKSAGWIPSYDIRAKTLNKPINLVYRAQVYQQSGEDWNNATLSISSGNPTQGGTKPSLSKWYLSFYNPPPPRVYYERSKKENVLGYAELSAGLEDKVSEKQQKIVAADFTPVVENVQQTTIQYDVKSTYNIPSDGKKYSVNLKEVNVDAEYQYFCVPKLDKDAFLTAKIANWEKLNLLNGEASIYFEGTYMGKSNLNPNNTEDTLTLSLGRDKSIVVTREKAKNFVAKQFIGSNKKETKVWEIEVKNNKSQPVKINIQDQFPISTNKEIQVEYIDYSGGKLDENTGIVNWNFELSPLGSKKLKTHYEVKYPKEKQVSLE